MPLAREGRRASSRSRRGDPEIGRRHGSAPRAQGALACRGCKEIRGGAPLRGHAQNWVRCDVPELRTVYRRRLGRCHGRPQRPGREPGHRAAAGEVPHAAAADTEAAIDAAERGLAAWRSKTAFERADALHAIADEMIRRKDEAARMISTETGKPLAQAEREWGLSVDQFRWYAEEARRIYGRIVESRVPGGRFEVTREPIGIVAAFTAWNFPAALLARKVAPALAAGCSVIVAAVEPDAGRRRW